MADSKLFTPLTLTPNIHLQHRLVMAPLTRYRASSTHVPSPVAKEYYAQRASTPGTLLISEATFISPAASGLPNAPGLWADDQLAAWKEVTDAVHAKGSYIFAQLWAIGRAARKDVLGDKGFDVVSSSNIPITDNSPTPRALTEDEIQQYIKDYATAARTAVEKAGFDGVEIHGANGYLVDQFTQDNSNNRTDAWGGSVEKRARFGLEVTKAVVEAVGAKKTAIRLSPWSRFQSMRMADPVPQFSYLVKGLKDLNLAYLHLVESRVAGSTDVESSDRLDFLVNIWDNQSPIFLAGGFKPDSAKIVVDQSYPERDIAVVFGRYFITNPDLVFRIKKGIELAKYDRGTFYTVGSLEGYADYPFSREFVESEGSKL